MSEIPYVNRLGDALDAVATRSFPLARRRHTVHRLIRRHPLLAFGLGLVLAGCGATAATLLTNNVTLLAARGLTCASGTSSKAPFEAFIEPAGLRPPTIACASVLHMRASRLIACASAQFGVVVYLRDGHADQCAESGMSALPVGYQRASDRLGVLIRDLNRLYATRNCFRPEALVAATQATLNTLGFRGWRAVWWRAGGTQSYPCGQFPGSGARWSDAASALTGAPRARTVDVTSGPSRHVHVEMQEINRLDPLAATGSHCYSLTGVESLVRRVVRSVAGPHVELLFAANAEPPNTDMGLGRQSRYEAGCATLVAADFAPSGALDVLIWQKGWPALRPGASVPQSAYRAVLRRS